MSALSHTKEAGEFSVFVLGSIWDEMLLVAVSCELNVDWIALF